MWIIGALAFMWVMFPSFTTVLLGLLLLLVISAG
jgi:hypothetical protein